MNFKPPPLSRYEKATYPSPGSILVHSLSKQPKKLDKEKLQKITQGCRLGWVDAGKLGDSGCLTGMKEKLTTSGDIGVLGPKEE